MRPVQILVACAVAVQVCCATPGDAPRNDAPRSVSTAVIGVVRDQSGAVIAGVQVDLRSSSETAFQRTTLTNTAGEFAFANIPGGAYRLTCALTGFQTVTRDASVNTEQFVRLVVELPVLREGVR